MMALSIFRLMADLGIATTCASVKRVRFSLRMVQVPLMLVLVGSLVSVQRRRD